MTLSAKRLGERCGLTAEEMNILLKEEGFLSGEPGNYYPTEEGYVLQKADGKATTIHKYVGMIPGRGLHIFKMPLI